MYIVPLNDSLNKCIDMNMFETVIFERVVSASQEQFSFRFYIADFSIKSM